jgi:hypothetical protein
MSFVLPNGQYFTNPINAPSYPSVVPSAPLDEILHEEEPLDGPLYPPVHQGFYQPVMPSNQGLYSQASQSVPLIIPPTYPTIDFQKLAAQAYLNIWPDLNLIHGLPTIQLDDKSIETLKQMEVKSNKGVILRLLNLTIRVLQVVGKLALGIAVGISIALILSLFFGTSVGTILLSAVIALPPLGLLVSAHLACKGTAYVLKYVRQKWIENSFKSALTAKKDQVLQLMAWTNLKDLPQIEQRIRDASQQIIQAQQFAGYDLYRDQQIAYLTLTLQKIEGFLTIQQKLNPQNTLPLLNRFLNN